MATPVATTSTIGEQIAVKLGPRLGPEGGVAGEPCCQGGPEMAKIVP